MPEYRELGTISRLQIQRSSLKIDGEPRRYYDPTPIQTGERLQLADGHASIDIDGSPLLDVHCASHSQSRNRGHGNMLSILFEGHYQKMRDRFGEHVADGVAGENILIDNAGVFQLEDLNIGLMIEGKNGMQLEFNALKVAAPCVEFSRFCLDDRNADPRDVADVLRFLGNGTRGFYATIGQGLPTTIQLGDRLLLRS